MQNPHVYPDIFQKIGEFLDPDSLFNIALTCKAAYRAFSRPILQQKISWPLLKPKRLTYDQREVVQQMEKMIVPVKLIIGSVGAGKSVCSLAYALRKGYDKIFIITPPNLITMWDNTCINFFGIKPFILHNSNSKYNWQQERVREIPHEDRVFIISHLIFSKSNFSWMSNLQNVAYIIDEAHHFVDITNRRCDDLIALSATAFKREHLTYGIRNILEQYATTVENVTFKLDKTVIAKKLSPVHHLQPHIWKINNSLADHILSKKRRPMRRKDDKKQKENDLRDIKWIPEILSHTFLPEYERKYLGGALTVRNKSFDIATNKWSFNEKLGEYITENQGRLLKGESYKNLKKEFEKEEQEKYEEEINEMIRSNIKYKQCLIICEYLKKVKEKGIIFDVNVTYLPFLYKYLTDRGINCYMFTTHYDVTSRQKQLEKFKNDKSAQVLLSSISMLGEGHNVTEANHVISLSTFLEENKEYQAIGRCHRYPQNKPVYVHYLFNSEFDRKIYEHSKGKVRLDHLDWEELLRK